jgi:hypothetical protein
MAKKIAIDTPAPLVLPLEPWIIIDGKNITATETGCEAIRLLAGAHKFQETIAAIFGITARQFKTLLGDGLTANPARLAWESGRAFAKQRLVDVMIERAEKGDMNSGMYITRAMYGLYDKAAAGAVNVEVKPTFAFISPKVKDFSAAAADAMADGYAAVLPGSYAPTEEGEREYMDSIGQKEITDNRSPESRANRLRITMGNPPTPSEATPPKAVAPPVAPIGLTPEAEERRAAFQKISDQTTADNLAVAKKRGLIQ